MNNPVKKIRILNIRFNGELAGHEIPAFRGAIAQKVGFENVLFHNHLGKESFMYRYPLIQYKNIRGKPSIVCIEQGVDEIHNYFQQKDWSIEISGRKLDMKIENLNLNQFTMQVWDKMWEYDIRNWIALNEENFHKYKLLTNEVERADMLTAIMKGNIISMAKGIEWTVSKPMEIEIKSSTIQTKPVKLKGNKLIAFNLEFKTNVFLPNFIGLGKGVSHGYGMVRGKRKGEE
jgi:hypothetical protein